MKQKTKKQPASTEVHIGGGTPKRKKGLVLSVNRIVALVFLLAFGAIGAHYLFASHADSYNMLYKLAYPGGAAGEIYQTTDANSASLEQSHGWKLLGQYKYVNEPGSVPVGVYEGHKTGTRLNYYTTNPATIPAGYVNKGIVFQVSSSATVPYGYCRSTTSGYKLDVPCSTNPAPVTKPAPAPTPAPTTGSTSTNPTGSKGGTAPTPVATGKAPVPLKANHNPYGYIDYCTFTNGSTVIYGWANDPDAPNGTAPNVSIYVHKLAHDPAQKGADPSVALAPNVVPTDGANYRDNAINAYIKKYHQGDPITGTYGFRAAYAGLTKDGFYQVSGTVINFGQLGSNDTLAVNTGRHVDGDSTKPYFTGGLIPDACLAPTPKTKNVPAPAPTTAPVAKPVASPKPIAHGVITVTGKVDCTDKDYVPVGNSCEKIKYKDIAHGKTAINADKTVCDDGYAVTKEGKKDACKLDNNIVVAYAGYNDGCGGNATHYAHDKKTHVSQKNYGKNSVCKCAATSSFVAYTNPMNDSKNNQKCYNHSASSGGSQIVGGGTHAPSHGVGNGGCSNGSWYTTGNGGGKTYYRCNGGSWTAQTCPGSSVAVSASSNDGPCQAVSLPIVQSANFCRANGLTYDAQRQRCGSAIKSGSTDFCDSGIPNGICKLKQKPGQATNNRKKPTSGFNPTCIALPLCRLN